MKSIIRNLLLIILAFQFLFLTGCSSTWYGCAAILEIAYGFTTAVTDRDVCTECETADIVIIPWPPDPDPVIPEAPVSVPDRDDTHDAETGWHNHEQNVKPAQDTHRENDSDQSDTARRPFSRR